MNPRTLALSLPLLFSPACGGEHANGQGDDHAALHAAVHEGAVVVDIGDDHLGAVEVAVEPDSGGLHLWFWDAHLEKTIRLNHESLAVEVTVGDETFSVDCGAQASELTGETVGDSAEFRGTDPRLEGAANVIGRLPSVTIKGGLFQGLTFGWTDEHNE